jgi:hypothetical protein
MNKEIKQYLIKLEAEIKYKPRLVYARDRNNGDLYRFRFHQLDSAGQARMAKALRKRGLVVWSWGGTPVKPESQPVCMNRWLCLLDGLKELVIDFFKTAFGGMGSLR